MNPFPLSRPRQGFTLVEMLVVIAIIALLVSLIFPAVTGAIDQARTTACASNMRQIAGAVIQFASANEGKLPYFQSPKSVSTNSSWGGELVEGGFIDAPFSENHGDVPANSVFLCPSGINDTASSGILPGDPWTSEPDAHYPWASAHDIDGQTFFLHTGYALNARTENTGWPFWRPSSANGERTTILDVRLPASNVMMNDGVWTHNGSEKRIYARHGTPRRYTNIAFMDGSVKRFTTRLFNVWENRDRETYPMFRLYNP